MRQTTRNQVSPLVGDKEHTTYVRLMLLPIYVWSLSRVLEEVVRTRWNHQYTLKWVSITPLTCTFYLST